MGRETLYFHGAIELADALAQWLKENWAEKALLSVVYDAEMDEDRATVWYRWR